MAEIWWRTVPVGTIPADMLETFRDLSLALYGVDLAQHETRRSRHLAALRAERRFYAAWEEYARRMACMPPLHFIGPIA